MSTPNNHRMIRSIPVLVWWLFWLLLGALIIHRFQWSWYLSFLDSAISIALLAIVSWIILNTYRFYRPVESGLFYRMGYTLGLSTLTLFLQSILYSSTSLLPENYALFFEQSGPVRFAIYFLIITSVAVSSWLMYYVIEKKATELCKTEAETLVREAELSRLRQQLQPHFLFNSLNSISALAGSDPHKARTMIQQLSDFLRGTLRKDENQLVPLSEELKHIQLYLDIEKVRFGSRLQTLIDSSESAEQCFLPSLLLQPVVENAIKFGLYDTTDVVTITITAELQPNHLFIKVTNPFDPTTAKPKSGTGYGLSAINRRLYLIYARQDLLMSSSEGGLFTTTLHIPFST